MTVSHDPTTALSPVTANARNGFTARSTVAIQSDVRFIYMVISNEMKRVCSKYTNIVCIYKKKEHQTPFMLDKKKESFFLFNKFCHDHKSFFISTKWVTSHECEIAIVCIVILHKSIIYLTWTHHNFLNNFIRE